MILKPLGQISEADITGLLTNGVPESVTLEYKRDLPGTADADKREFLADASAFANTQGGDLLYGIDEAAGIPTAIPGVVSPDLDAEVLRLENLLRDGLDPRISTHCRRVPVGLQTVLVLRTQRSWNGPHRVVFRGHDKFYARNASGKYALDTSQLRSAFLGTADQFRRVRDLRIERIINIARDDTPLPVRPGAKLVMHCIPIPSFLEDARYNVLPLQTTSFSPLRPPAAWRTTLNFDGIIVHDMQAPHTVYTQLYRHGTIEAVDAITLNAEYNGAQILPSQAIERSLITYVPQCLKIIKDLGATPPVAVAVSFLGIQGRRIAVPGMFDTASDPINRDALLLPEVIAQHFTDAADVLLKPSLDLLWNAFGYERSPYFDAQGKFKGNT